VTEETASLVSPAGIQGITFTDPVVAANRVADQLSDGNAANGEADVVVLLAHEGSATVATDPASCATMAARADAFGHIVRDADANIDAIIGGHTHLAVDCTFPHPRGNGLVRPVLEANSYGTTLDRIQMTVDPDTDTIMNVSSGLVPVTGFTPDPAVAQLVAQAVDSAAVVGRVPVGRITQDITRAFDTSTTPPTEDRGSESVLGNFIADVQLAATAAPNLGGAQIALMNPGGLRADLLYASSPGGEGDGVVTYSEAAEVQPFANGVVTMSLTGAQIKQALEEQWQPAGSSRPFLHLGVSKGFHYTIDPSAAKGSHVSALTLNGVPIDPDATYRVTVNAFLAAGGDNFPTLAQGTARQDNGFNDLNVLVDYLTANSPVTPDTASRVTILGPLVDPLITDLIVDTPTAAAGSTVEYAVRVTTSEALPYPFDLELTLPEGVRWVSGPAGCTVTGGRPVCRLGGLDRGTTTLRFRVALPLDVAAGNYGGAAVLRLAAPADQARQTFPKFALFIASVEAPSASYTRVEDTVRDLRAQGKVSSRTAPGLIDRLEHAKRLAAIGSETRTIGYLEQFIARVNNQVRDAGARAQLIAPVRSMINDLLLLVDLEYSSAPSASGR
jgi:2',3'-cyclic-nucleotide 2'-phosphodiesterase (5'-nucleotidase family)